MRLSLRLVVREQVAETQADVQEAPPTSDQLSSILEYIGPSKAGIVIKDATGISDALRKFKASENSFQCPLVVDWNNGRAGKSFCSLGWSRDQRFWTSSDNYDNSFIRSLIFDSRRGERERDHEAGQNSAQGDR